jgi:glycosyltransferase involved in cell wall biosynthesis
VLFLGRITEQKGAMQFLDVAERVLREVPQTRFVMAGEGDQIPEVLLKAGKMGLKNRLSMTGFLSRNGVARILSATDVLLFPSITDPFGISPLEAMSHEVAVVISKQSGVSEVVQNVVKCDAWNTVSMASAVVELIRNPGKRKALGKKAAREAKLISRRYHLLHCITRTFIVFLRVS